MSPVVKDWKPELSAARQFWETQRTPQAFESYVMWCAGYLCSPELATTNTHWFCSDAEIQEIALNSLAMFSFVAPEDPADPAFAAYHRYLAAFTDLVSSCERCARGYQQCREELVLRLFADGPFEQKQVVSFVKELNHKDRTRLAAELAKRPVSLPVLTETLWSATCIKAHGFVSKHLIEAGLLSNDSQLLKQVGPCPGMLCLAFTHHYKVRQVVMKHIIDNAEDYEVAWKQSKEMFKHLYTHGLKSYSKAKVHADLAWFTAAQIVRALGGVEGLLDISLAELAQEQLGLPKFGAHFLLTNILSVCSRKQLTLKESDLDRTVRYVCAPGAGQLLKYATVDTEASQAAQMSETYKKLSARTVIDWVKLYAQLKVPEDPNALAFPIAWMLQLPRTAYDSTEIYGYAVRTTVRIVSENMNSQLWLLLDEHADRIAASIDRCSPEPIWSLWQRQVTHQMPFLSLWTKIVKSPSLPEHVAHAGRGGYVIGLLQGSRDAPLIYKQPKVNTDPPSPTQVELFLKEFLETLADNVEVDALAHLLRDPQALHSVLFATTSGNRGLALAAEEFMKTATGSDTFQATLLELVMHRAEQVLDILDTLLSEAYQSIGDWFSVLSGVLKLCSETLEQVYAPQSGVETTNPKLLRKLKDVWPASWSIVRVVLSNIRTWAREYGNSHAKPIISEILEFSQRLLSKFRLLEGDLATGLSDTSALNSDQHWGTVLAQPVMKCVPAMADLLQLSMPEMLAVAHEIIIEMLGLMRSFEVKVPSDLFTLFKNLGNHTRNSKLSEDQLRELLTATGLLSDEQVTEVMNAPREAPDSSGKAGQSGLSSRLPSSQSSQGQQRPISDFFFRGSGPQAIPQRAIVNNQVVPSAPRQPSNMAMLRSQLSAGSHQPQPLKRQPITIHPERPPGFNQRKPLQDESDDTDDEDGGALSMLNEKRREEAAAKLREAYNRPRASLITSSAAEQQRLARQAKDQATRRMKARLSVDPTELHRVMLQWDYFATKPPFKADASVPDVFSSVDQYEKVMSPLLFLEAWEQIQNAKLDVDARTLNPFDVTVGKRVKVDGFTDAYVSVAKGQYAEAGVGESDLILLGKKDDASSDPYLVTQDMPHCLARLKEGTVRQSGSKQRQFVDLQIRVNDAGGFFSSLRQGDVVCAQVVGNMRTVEREFCALKALPYYDLANAVINATPALPVADPEKVSRLEKTLGLNKSQAEAVSGAVSNDGFTLIQGPPGTGKTKTILGIVGSYFTSNEIVAQTQKGMDSNKKLLICAPSNAAVDEIVLRLKNGINDATGKHFELNVLRLGRVEAMSEQVKDMSLEEKVRQSISNAAEPVDEQLRRDHTALTQERDELRQKLANTDNSLSEQEVLQLRNKLTDTNKAIREKNYALDTQRDRLEQARKQKDLKFRQQQKDILMKAQVVCTTLSASAHPLLGSLGVTFPTVIIDEAAQSIELSALIPLRYGCTQCIMVGDPNQLPPTVISRAASRLKYEQSLFVRMFSQHRSTPGMVSMLDTQFRMHPDISLFPSKEFYDSRLKDGLGLAEQRRRPWHAKYPALGPYTFFEVKGRHERSNGRSLRNTSEAKAAVALVELLRREFPDVESVGVISPYREQVRLLRQMFVQEFGAEITAYVDFNSIDGFQGQEKDVIIMSCVRASSAQTDSIGFLGDVRRLNVAVTRAKSSLWILGSSNSLAGNEVWRSLIEDAAERGRFCKAEGKNFMSAVTKFKEKPTKPFIDTDSRETTPTRASPAPYDGTGRPQNGDLKKRKAKVMNAREKAMRVDSSVYSESRAVGNLAISSDVPASDGVEPVEKSISATAPTAPQHREAGSGTKRDVDDQSRRLPARGQRAKGASSVFIQPRRGAGARRGRT